MTPSQIALQQDASAPTQTVLRAIAQATDLIDPLEVPPDPALLAQWGAQRALQSGVLPWRDTGSRIIVLAANIDTFATYRGALMACFGAVQFAPANPVRCQEAIQRIADPELVALAETRADYRDSCRMVDGARTARWFLSILIVAGIWAWFAPASLIIALSFLATSAALMGSLYKTAAAISHLRAPPRPDDPPLDPDKALPVISVLVPLFREEHIAEHLLERLKQLNYPRDRLDLILVVERHDKITQQTIARTQLPPWIRPITVPRGSCQTKPRAMNYALDFARGEIIGVYDAEDAPAPDQLLVVARRFAVTPPTTVCLQGVLDFYNSQSNWLSRCFTIEYAAWFRVVMPGLERLGFILPLGGTTLFFRRHVLEELGAWDAHNVTEDADLGVRLARHGYRTEMIPTITEEEANARAWPWIKQRSRWLKGYALTYWVAMRRPRQLIQQVGLWQVLGLNLQFVTTLTTFVLTPLLWSFWLGVLGLGHPFLDLIGARGVLILAVMFVLAEALTITVSALGAYFSGRKWLVKWAPTMHLYYPLAAIACYKALWELASNPFYWDKTAHGIYQPTPPQS